MRRATSIASAYVTASRNFNPRSPCGERRRVPYRPRQRYGISTRAQPGVGIQRLISIRAPLAGSDLAQSLFRTRRTYFNPRSPFGERPEFTALPTRVDIFQSALPLRGATSLPRSHRSKRIFQSALPLRGATRRTPTSTPWCSYFNPRSPCGERRKRRSWLRCIPYFNPRSPCGERRRDAPGVRRCPRFQSALPLRGATFSARSAARPSRDFNPRSPCGERQPSPAAAPIASRFQSALPLRGAT